MKNYCYPVLFLSDLGITATAKFFLIRVLRCYRFTEVNDLVVTLERVIGMSDYLLKKVRTELVNKGYLTMLTSCTEGKQGRPRMAFKISDSFKVKLDSFYDPHSGNYRKPLPIYATRLEMLFENNYKNKKLPISQMKPDTRVLLAVLYCHADDCGVVRGLGRSALGRLAGMAVDRLDTHLDNLFELKYILSQVSGVTSKYLFGLASSVIYLNIYFDNLISSNENKILIMYQSTHYESSLSDGFGRKFSELIRRHKYALDSDIKNIDNFSAIQRVKANFKSGVFVGVDLRKVGNPNPKDILRHAVKDYYGWMDDFISFDFEHFFDIRNSEVLADYIDLKVGVVATVLISKFFNDLNLSVVNLIDEVVYEIKKEFFSSVMRKKFEKFALPEYIGKERLVYEAFVLLIYRAAYQEALYAKYMIILGLTIYPELKYSIKSLNFTILATPISNYRGFKKTAITVGIGDISFLDRESCLCMLFDSEERIEVKKAKQYNYALDGEFRTGIGKFWLFPDWVSRDEISQHLKRYMVSAFKS